MTHMTRVILIYTFICLCDKNNKSQNRSEIYFMQLRKKKS